MADLDIDELAALDATAQAELVRSGRVSPLELVGRRDRAARARQSRAQRGDPH